ncbi:DUF6979 family protein [Bacteroidota bacterium]
MGRYGNVAVKAAQWAQKYGNPINAWEKFSIDEFGLGSPSQIKGCPKNAFLGICEEGKIQGVPSGRYTKSEKNKKYALSAIELLVQNPQFSDKLDLWNKVLLQTGEDPNKQHNEQMDVVLSLWKENLVIH